MNKELEIKDQNIFSLIPKLFLNFIKFQVLVFYYFISNVEVALFLIIVYLFTNPY